MNELSLKERRANWFRDAWMSVAVGLVPMISCVLVAAL